jgi:hypothetical protein
MEGQLDEMQAEQRPWLKVEVSVKGNLFPAGPYFGLPVNITITNVGHSPAFNVQPFSFLYAAPPAHSSDLEIAQRGFCEKGRRFGIAKPPLDTVLAMGTTMFPGDHDPSWNWSGVFPIATSQQSNLKDVSFMEQGRRVINLWLVGCVDYAFGTPAVHHQTGFIYHVMEIGTDGDTEDIELGKAVPQKQITLGTSQLSATVN